MPHRLESGNVVLGAGSGACYSCPLVVVGRGSLIPQRADGAAASGVLSGLLV